MFDSYPKMKQVLLPEEVFKRSGERRKQPERDLIEKCRTVMFDETDLYRKKKVQTYGVCDYHVEYYNSYPYALIDYIGKDKFNEYLIYSNRIGDTDLTDICSYSGMSVIDVIEYFGTTREVFEEIFNGTPYGLRGFDSDLIFSGNMEKIEEFFTRRK